MMQKYLYIMCLLWVKHNLNSLTLYAQVVFITTLKEDITINDDEVDGEII